MFELIRIIMIISYIVLACIVAIIIIGITFTVLFFKNKTYLKIKDILFKEDDK